MIIMNRNIILILFASLLLIGIVSALPTNVIYYYSINLNNSQTTNTSANFSMNISFNGLNNNTLLNGNASNVIFFYANNTIIPSWFIGNYSNPIQTSSFNTSTTDMWWLNLTNMTNPSILNNTVITIYMGFGNMTTNFYNGTTVGAAPELYCATSACHSNKYGGVDN